ncbi:iron-sulfur cluster assembly scaffold protein [Euryarchaeota archaeon SM23-78]|nr:MAG: iron-sulfur cluster assembly scaffold protein [Euryarchaeota archaeon SM23-78]MBW3001512.1 iron-sulfur cluster assembly scaffold protein [Candidatus Woesearchaeota archaeon]
MSHLNYTKKVIEEFKHPSNIGEIKNPDGHGIVGNPTCGDMMEIFLRIKNNKIIDIKAKTFGCIAAIATTSVMTKMVKGKTVEQAKKITKQDIIKRFGKMPPVKIHCSVLGLNALHKAIEDYEKKKK